MRAAAFMVLLFAVTPALAGYTLPTCQRFKSHVDPNWMPPGYPDPTTLTNEQLLGQSPVYGPVMRELERRGMVQDVPQNPGHLRDLAERDQREATWACWQTLTQCADDACRKVGFQACMAARGRDCSGEARSDSVQTNSPEHPNVATPQLDVDACVLAKRMDTSHVAGETAISLAPGRAAAGR
jgi:hypothetical protein